MKKLIGVLFVLALIAGAFFLGRRTGPQGQSAAPGQRKILYWVDPMHPAYKSDKPGIAPDCGMKLEPVYADQGPAAASPTGKILYYRDPKSPEYKADKPGLNPETGNELEPVYEQPSPGAVQVSADKQQLIGVRYGAPEWSDGSITIRASGKVAVDETRIVKVHSKTEGWIEKVLIDFTGQYVKKGQPMATLYSPELLATQQEYLLALKSQDILGHSGLSHVSSTGSSMIEAARKRLELWDLTDQQIDELERTKKPVKNITLYSPASGYITARNSYPNQKIMPDTELYAITDLSQVWIMADVFESDIPHIRVGQPVSLKASYDQAHPLRGRVSYILPQIDPATRTLKVRIDAANPGMKLKPEMFVEAEFAAGLGRILTVPTDAILDAGLKKTVFVDMGDGHLEPRQVETGERMGDRVQILKGVKAGDRIVTSGTFLIDSESQMRAAAAGGEHKHD